MSNMNSDRNLVIGLVAVQLDFISQQQLMSAMQVWLLRKSRPLEEILHEQGALSEDAKRALETVVEVHLKLHGGDASQSLSTIGLNGALRVDLRGLGDQDVETSLAQVGSKHEAEDPYATIPPPQSAASRLESRFRIEKFHAQGGLGKVSIARDLELNRKVALKEIQEKYADNSQSRTRFVREAEITGGLEHPGIVPVYGFGCYPDGRPYYAMRFIRGDSLLEAIHQFHQSATTAGPSDWTAGERSVEFRKLLGHFIAVCNTIEYVHSRGVLHRDLKPANVMLGKYAETLVVDWGFAKSTGREQVTSSKDESSIDVSSGSDSPTQQAVC